MTAPRCLAGILVLGMVLVFAIKSYASTSVALLPFADHWGENSGQDQSGILTSLVYDRISDGRVLILIDSVCVRETLAHSDIDTPSILDAEWLGEIGTLLHVKYVLSGRLESTNDSRAKLSLDAVRISDGKVMGSWCDEGQYPEDRMSMVSRVSLTMMEALGDIEILDQFTRLETDKPPFGIRVWTNSHSYARGDSLTILFESERDCFLRILDLTTSGKVYLLFPNMGHPSGFIRGGVTHSIPSADDGFKIRVGGPPGIETIKAIAAEREDEFPPLLSSMETKMFRQLETRDVGKLRGASVAGSRTMLRGWSVATARILIE